MDDVGNVVSSNVRKCVSDLSSAIIKLENSLFCKILSIREAFKWVCVVLGVVYV